MKSCVQSSLPQHTLSTSLSNMSSGGGGDEGSRVSIPADLRETIQNIREVTGKQHSDHDIFSVFKECFNDPHETAQKLLYLDTFHEVRTKRERKKESLLSNTQGRGRNDRRNFASSYSGNSGRRAAFKRQSEANHIVGGSRTALPAPSKAINDTIPCPVKPSNPTSPPSGVSNHIVTEEQPIFKSTSSEDVVELKKSKATTAPVSDSVVDVTSQITQISRQSSTFTKQDHMLVAASNSGSQSDQVTSREDAANKGNNQSLLKSDVGERSHVTFPVHLKVAKMLENGLTFGSFDSNFVKEAPAGNGTNGCDDSNIKSSNGTASNGASVRKDVSTFSQNKEHEISSSASEIELALQSDQNPVEDPEVEKRMEELSPIMDAHQAANYDAPPISYPDQCSIAASQQAMHVFRQQYPLNFFPYGLYFQPFYMPQPYIQQFLSPALFQQQSCLPPGDDAPGDKIPLPHTKSGNSIRYSPSTTITSPCDSYTVAFNGLPSAATVNSTHKEGQKEPIYTTGRLSPASLQANHMYNLSLQGQPLAFPTMQARFTGIYQQTQPILAVPSITEPIGLAHIGNQQPQAELTSLAENH